MNTKKTYRQKLLLTAAVAAAAALLAGCSLFSGDNSGGSSGGADAKAVSVPLTVNVSAAPAGVSSTPSESASSRSVYPANLPEGIRSYRMTATHTDGSTTTTVTGTEITAGTGMVKAYNVYLTATGDWTLTVNAYSSTDTQDDTTLLAYSNRTVTVADDTTALSGVTMYLRNATSSTTGTIALTATAANMTAYTITAATVTLTNASTNVVTEITYPVDKDTSDANSISLSGTTYTVSATVAAGQYTMVTVFSGSKTADHTAAQAVRVEQCVVWHNFTTDTWNNEDGTDAKTSWAVTDSDFVQRKFFAASSGTDDGRIGIAGNDTTGDGSIIRPYASVQKAIDAALAANDGSSTYYVYIDGAITYADGMTTGQDSNNNAVMMAVKTSSTVNLVIEGFAGDAEKDIVNADAVSSLISRKLMYVNGTGITVTVRSLTLTGGYGETYGGILIDSGTLVLDYGTAIESNVSSNNGGGIAAGGNTGNSGTIILKNSGTNTTAPKITDNSANNGGGIYVYNYGIIELDEGTVSTNTATGAGGAAYVSAAGTLKMSGGITVKESTAARTNDIYLPTGAYITVTGALTSAGAGTITPQTYTPGTVLVKGYSPASGTAYALKQTDTDKFSVTDDSSATPVQPYAVKFNASSSSPYEGILAKTGVTTNDLTPPVYTLVPSATVFKYGGTSNKITLAVKDTDGNAVTSGVTSQTIRLLQNGTAVAQNTGTAASVTLPSVLPEGDYQLYAAAVVNGNTYDGYKSAEIIGPSKAITTYAALKTAVESGTDTTLYIQGAMTATEKITVDRDVTIVPMTSDTKITRGSSFTASPIFSMSTSGKTLSLGTLNSTEFALDGGSVAATAPLIVNSGTLNMNNCTLQNNYNDCTNADGTAPDSTGGAVYSTGILNLNAGSRITGCKAYYGGGVYVAGGTFSMQGSAVVTPAGTGANSVYLASGKYITVGGTLTAAAAATIQAADCSCKGGTATVLKGTTDYTLTKTDCGKFTAYGYTATPVTAKNAFTGCINLSSSTAPGTGTMIGFGEATVIATGSTATVAMTDDSSWSGYYSGTKNLYKGVFLKDRTVQLSAYDMGQYEVTQGLYTAVMETNPSISQSNPADGETQSLRPVEYVRWYDALVFCNKLSELMGYAPCYTIVVSGIATSDTSKWGTVPTATDTVWDAAVCDLTKNGYRLPTEAEWEFAARGGNVTADAWKYAYAGVAAVTGTTDITSSTTDTNLADYAWYGNNCGAARTHEAGKQGANALGLYDMSGNVSEWCWDWYANDATLNDSSYTKNGAVVNPKGAASAICRILRGGSWGSDSYKCAVSCRDCDPVYFRSSDIGFRICRSQ